MDLENYFIDRLQNRFIGDDGAVVGDMVYSKDAFFEDVHFKRSWMSYYQIASKAMAVNISDAIAMNATPKYALLSVAMPKSITKSEACELARGFVESAAKHGVEIIGGDTIANIKLDITITVISQTNKPLLRKGLRVGHLVAYTGVLGRSAKDLQKLMRLGKIHAKSKFVSIELRGKFVAQNRRYLKAGMDISDGIGSDLKKLSRANRVGFRFYQKIPKSVGCSGEEYEMLFGFDKRDKKALLRRAKLSRTPLSVIGECRRGSYKNRCKAHHF